MAEKKATSKKAAKKTAAKKTTAKKAAKKTVKKAAKKTLTAAEKQASIAAAEAEEAALEAAEAAAPPVEETPLVVKRRFVAPEKLAELTPFQQSQKAKLIALRGELTDQLYGIKQDAREALDSDNGSGEHQGDAGSDAYDRDFALSMLSKETDSLNEVEEALHRLDLGTYGICEASGEPIPEPRLEYLPFVRYTVEVQAQMEADGKTRRTYGTTDGFQFG